MTLEKVIEKYKKALKQGNIHAYLANSCFDRCGHCYLDTVPIHSCNARHLNKEDFIHFAELIKPEKGKQNLVFSGGDPFAHPKIIDLLEYFNEKANLTVMTSGLALSSRNPRRDELIQAINRSDAFFQVASPNEPYHSITWEDIKEIKEHIKCQGFNPNHFGYDSRFKDLALKTLAMVMPPVLIGKLLNKISGNNMPKVIGIGRAKNLPKEQLVQGSRDCKIEDGFNNIYLNYDGKIQYCLYTCHDGFMNISELRGINNKEEAVDYITNRLILNPTFKDIVNNKICYFDESVRKNAQSKELAK